MKKTVLILALLSSCMSYSFGQTGIDSITMNKVSGGYQFFQGGNRLSLNQLVNAMQPNAEAHKMIKSAKNTSTWASVVGGIGGFMIGWPLGTSLGGGKPNWAMAGVGAGLVVVSIPISQKFNKQAKKAVETYNGGTLTSSFWNKNELKLCMTANGFGLALEF